MSAIWEIAENTPAVIALFEHSQAGKLYRGDSLPNSLSDMLFMLAGFALALRLPGPLTLALGIGIEGLVALELHDSLVFGLIKLAAKLLPG